MIQPHRPARALVPILLGLTALACDMGPPTLEGYSEEAFTRSVDEVRASLDSADRPVFDSLLGLVLHRGRVVEDPVTEEALSSLGDTARRRLTGARLEELRRQADSSRARHLDVHMETLDIQITTERTTQRNHRRMQNLEVVDTSWRRTDEQIPDAYVYATLENHNEVALSRVRFHAEFVTPGRTVPWNEGWITIRLGGGIEPGERRTFQHEIVAAHRVLEQPFYETPESTTLELTPYTLYGPEGDAYATRATQPYEPGRLDSLRRDHERERAELEALRDSAGGG